MKRRLYVKRGTFITEQGFIQAFLMFAVCIGIPGMLLYIFDAFSVIDDALHSSILTAFCFVVMVSAPIIAILLVIFGNIYDYYCFNKDPQGIKAISLYDECVCLHCNKKIHDKTLKFDEIKYVKFSDRRANVINPNATSKGYKLGGLGFATAVAANTYSEFTYQVEMSIIDKKHHIYTMTMPTKFANNPYKEIEKVKDFFRKNNIDVR